MRVASPNWHRDPESEVFMYCSDVGDSAGPLEYIWRVGRGRNTTKFGPNPRAAIRHPTISSSAFLPRIGLSRGKLRELSYLRYGRPASRPIRNWEATTHERVLPYSPHSHYRSQRQFNFDVATLPDGVDRAVAESLAAYQPPAESPGSSRSAVGARAPSWARSFATSSVKALAARVTRFVRL